MADLPEDVRLDFIIRNGLLNKPEEYVRGVYNNAKAFERRHGKCTIRLGAGGSGYAPNYRIEFAAPPPKASPDELQAGMTTSQYIPEVEALKAANTFYGGASHKVQRPGLHHERWSTATDNEAALLAALKRLVEDRRRRASRN
ncbi:hypothetical protein [Rhizobium ruizarguesonis]|uniref:hypothetical protein n=1 Tax=Rhizobium ruizarguesonis TaxID=2081791 RepID=UPI001031DB04|nr:hypothetical protein [Rhizobium ruizarguesonis]TAW18730.1 hypothetical protein ELI25_24505 [Rhizobium ruizarguesonis]TAZ54407.1 hypothetical protein ELH76_26350 [Rhizobium ruizarguesonis]